MRHHFEYTPPTPFSREDDIDDDYGDYIDPDDIDYDEEDDDGDCYACAGTGEGSYDGSSCPVCKGTGGGVPF